MTNKQILTRFALPLTAAIVLLAGCKNQNTTEYDCNCDCAEFVINSLIRENRRLTDSLAVVQDRLDDCESARTKRCPCEKKPAQKPKITVPPVKKPVIKETVVTKPSTTTVTIEHNDGGNSTVVIGNNNTVKTIVINTPTKSIQDTLKQVEMTQHVLSGYTKSTYTYTK